jgi:hypothetical protein
MVQFTFSYSYSEASIARADHLSSYVKQEALQGTKKHPSSARPSVETIYCYVFLYHNCCPAQLLAGEVGPSE